MGYDPKDLEGKLGRPDCPVIIDVRSGFEFAAGHIPGALHLPLLKCLFRVRQEVPDREREVVLYCEHGPRAGLVKGLLGALGYRSTRCLDGHMHRWRRDRRKIEK